MNENTQKTGVHAHELFETLLPMLEEGHRAIIPVSGMSMWPFICHGRDQAILEACRGDDLHIGDIILFRTPLGNYMLHRVTALRPDAFETTGDGNCFRDGWFPRDCAKAKAISIRRNGHTIDCTAPGWRFIFACWRVLFPVRKPLLRLLQQIGRVKAKVRKWLAGN